MKYLKLLLVSVFFLPLLSDAQTRVKPTQIQGASSVSGMVLVWDSSGQPWLATIAAPLVLTVENGAAKLSVSSATTREVIDEALTPGATSTLQYAPTTGTVRLYRNGLRQRVGADYTISGQTITWTAAPQADDVLAADYHTPV